MFFLWARVGGGVALDRYLGPGTECEGLRREDSGRWGDSSLHFGTEFSLSDLFPLVNINIIRMTFPNRKLGFMGPQHVCSSTDNQLLMTTMVLFWSFVHFGWLLFCVRH